MLDAVSNPMQICSFATLFLLESGFCGVAYRDLFPCGR
jgi:hypothetical protein